MKHAGRTLGVVLSLVSCSPGGAAAGHDPAGATRPSQPAVRATGGAQQTTDGRHLSVRWRLEESTQEEVDSAIVLGEALFTAISRIVGNANTPVARVTVLLEGDALAAGDATRTSRNATGPSRNDTGPSRNGYRIPHVDRAGRVHLYRFPHGYFEALGHELVHALRLLAGHWKGGFFEEGFASLIGDTVQPERRGFPLYGYPLVVVAGQWLERGEGLPMTALLLRHRELSLRCMAQSYSLRASFFRYLRQEHGIDAVLAAAHDRRPFDIAGFQAYFGSSLQSAEADWRADLLSRFRAFPDAQEQAVMYRQQTPARFWEVCDAGVK